MLTFEVGPYKVRDGGERRKWLGVLGRHVGRDMGKLPQAAQVGESKELDRNDGLGRDQSTRIGEDERKGE